MSCPICDNKPANCDCSDAAIRLHEEKEQLLLQLGEKQKQYDIAINRIEAMETGRNTVNKELELMKKHADEGWNLANERTRQWKESERLLDEAKGLLQRFLDAGPEEEYQVILCRLSTDVEAFLLGKSERPNRVADENQPHTYWCREHSLLMPKESLCPKCVEKLTEKRNNEAPLVCPHGAIHERGWGTCRLCSEAGVPQAPQRGRDTCVECGANRAHWNSR